MVFMVFKTDEKEVNSKIKDEVSLSGWKQRQLIRTNNMRLMLKTEKLKKRKREMLQLKLFLSGMELDLWF